MTRSDEGFEFGCKMFYVAHWFRLDQHDFSRLLSSGAAAGVQLLCDLEQALQEANPEDHNACIEQWCWAPQEQLSGKSPSDLIKGGRGQEVIALVKALGKLPGEELLVW